VNAPADTASNTGVALTAAFLIAQRLEVRILVRSRHVSVAFVTRKVGMSGRRKGNVCVAFTAIDVLRVRSLRNQEQKCQSSEQQAGKTYGRCHLSDSLKSASLVSQ